MAAGLVCVHRLDMGSSHANSALKEATMKKILTGALAALTIGGALAASAVPAAAYPHGGGYYHGGGYRGGGWGWGVGGALAGLAVGAAIADSARPVYYGPPPAYYAAPRCRVEMRWNPNWGGYDRVRVCY
jgi:hypothetical protein